MKLHVQQRCSATLLKMICGEIPVGVDLKKHAVEQHGDATGSSSTWAVAQWQLSTDSCTVAGLAWAGGEEAAQPWYWYCSWIGLGGSPTNLGVTSHHIGEALKFRVERGGVRYPKNHERKEAPRMRLSTVENLSGLCGSIFNISRGPQRPYTAKSIFLKLINLINLINSLDSGMKEVTTGQSGFEILIFRLMQLTAAVVKKVCLFKC